MTPPPCGAARRAGTPRRARALSLAALFLAASPASQSAVNLPRILGDRMVLQRDRPVPIWGTADPGEAIAVRFAGQEKRAATGPDGRWRITLDPLPASSEPRTMIIAGQTTLALHDILVGEVWLCSGQSNMEYPASRPHWGQAERGAPPPPPDPAALRELANVDLPEIRLFRVEKKIEPPDVVSSGWEMCREPSLVSFSAVAYYFGRKLHQALGIPVGLIQSAWGGSRIEKFTPPSAYATVAAFRGEVSRQPLEIDGYRQIGNLYRGIVGPLAPFALRGVLWYQGESNINDGLRYADKMLALVNGWRAAWDSPDLPFYAVQLAPFAYAARRVGIAVHSREALPELWEAQFLAQRIAHVGLVPTIDQAEDLSNQHPRFKRVVGERLAALALAKTYGQTGRIWSGPVFERLEIAGGEAIVHFRGVGAGLASRDGEPLTNFEIAGADGRFFPAEARLAGATIIAAAREVPAPRAVRFGWDETAEPNLINRDGWPAYPFRTNGPTWSPR